MSGANRDSGLGGYAKLVFSSTTGSTPGRNQSLYSMNADGTDGIQLTPTPADAIDEGDMDPNWSPDQSRIVFDRWEYGVQLYVMNADGSGVSALTTSPPRDPNGNNVGTSYSAFPKWSPDGSKIVWSGFRNGIRQILIKNSADVFSQGGELIMSEDFYNDPEVCDFIAKNISPHALSQITGVLKGFDDPAVMWKLRV